MKKIVWKLYTLYGVIVFIPMLCIGVLLYFLAVILIPKHAVEILYRYIYYWGRLWLFLMGIKLIVKGEEHVAHNQSYVIISNHMSQGDMFPLAASLKIPYRPLGKIELKKAPLLGFIFRKTLVFVDRSDAESRKKSLLEMRTLLGKNISVIIFPEGTRNRTGKPLKEFYDGAFRLAVETQTPLLPLVFCNTLHLWSNDAFLIRPVLLKAIFLPPVQTVGLTEDDIPRLKQHVHTLMEKVILQEDMRFTGPTTASVPANKKMQSFTS